jgi:hypothetical protein
MHVDEAGQQQAAATLDIGILDRLVADLGNPALFDPDGAAGDDAVAQDNFEFTQPHAISLFLFEPETGVHFSGHARIGGFKVDFPVDEAGDILLVMEGTDQGEDAPRLPPPRSWSLQDIRMFHNSIECLLPFDFYDISMKVGLHGALASAGK